MKHSEPFEFPERESRIYRQARRLEWLTLAYLLSVTVLMYFVLGSSQAMKTAWLDDILSMIAPAVFLIASKIALWPPNPKFPYGYHRAVSIAFLCSSVTLLGMGTWLLVDAVIKLASAEHPTIGGITLFGHTFWLGWLMLPTLAYSGIPAVVLGHMKLPLASAIHDKVLFADAKMNKADWLTALAAFIGVLGIGWGYWWADALAAGIISLDIMHDGYANLREAISNLIDEVPKTVDKSQIDKLPQRVKEHLQTYPWVRQVRVRMREAGHVYFGEAFVVVEPGDDLPAKLEQATQACLELDWRMHDLVLVVATRLDAEEES